MGGAAFRHPAATVMLFKAPTDIALALLTRLFCSSALQLPVRRLRPVDERHVIMNRYLARMNAQDIPAGLMEAAVVANDNENGILGLIRELSQSVTPAVGPALQVRVSALIHYVAGQPLAVNGDLVRCAAKEPLIELTDGTVTFDPHAIRRCLLGGGE
jgi:hypothetical protein